ncbi:MAG: glycosyltransferase family 4 protein [Paracoccaceae bacterium]
MDGRSLPKILIVASNASARFGGEAILPLHYFRLLSKRSHPVKMITHHRTREELLSLQNLDHRNLYFVPDTRWHKITWRIFKRFPERIRDLLGGTILTWLDELYQARLIRQLVREGHVDLIHQPTPVSPLIPSGLHKFGVPLVIGPMNGGMNYPDDYEDYEGRGTRTVISLGRRLALALNRLRPGKHRAATLLVANERTRKALPNPHLPQIQTLVENGIDFDLWKPRSRTIGSSAKGDLHLIYMGRFIKLKGIDITLQAVALARRQNRNITLDLLGDGEERSHLERLTNELGLTNHVTFHGFQPQSVCADIMSKGDALVLNSLRECGGAVILEAMATGLPVVGSAWGGPLDYITTESGILVNPTPRVGFAERLAEAFICLADDPDNRTSMGEAGKRIAEAKYDWERKIDVIQEIYDEAVTSMK